jgi:hypothetical protein
MTMTPQSAAAVQPIKTAAITKPAETQEVFDRMQRLSDSIARRAFDIF